MGRVRKLEGSRRGAEGPQGSFREAPTPVGAREALVLGAASEPGYMAGFRVFDP
jgi:hypothetical protein